MAKPSKANPATNAVGDAAHVAALIQFASDTAQLDATQATDAHKLLDCDKEIYPPDGCAITLSVLLQNSGFAVPDTFRAFDLGGLPERERQWQRVALGQQMAGDIGSTCSAEPHYGTDHIYLVLRAVSADEMIVADNQARDPHFRWVSGKGRAPTRYFLRAR